MAVRFLVFGALLLMTARAWSCSCFGTSSIEETIATHPNLVEVRASSTSVSAANLQVTRVLKGKVTSTDIHVEDSPSARFVRMQS